MPEAAVPAETPIIDMLFSSGPVVQAVLLILIGLSVMSWAIVIAKAIQMRRLRGETERFKEVFWDLRNFSRIQDAARRFSASPLVVLFTEGYRELTRAAAGDGARAVHAPRDDELKSVERALKRAEADVSERLDWGLTFLATVASAAPFIGLFGTVWGIMTAFQGLSTAKSTTIQAVAPGISEALVATAVGLAAAIPAAIAFNYFSVAVKRVREDVRQFAEDFLSIAKSTVYSEAA